MLDSPKERSLKKINKKPSKVVASSLFSHDNDPGLGMNLHRYDFTDDFLITQRPDKYVWIKLLGVGLVVALIVSLVKDLV